MQYLKLWSFQEKKTGETLCALGLGKDFLGMTKNIKKKKYIKEKKGKNWIFPKLNLHSSEGFFPLWQERKVKDCKKTFLKPMSDHGLVSRCGK